MKKKITYILSWPFLPVMLFINGVLLVLGTLAIIGLYAFKKLKDLHNWAYDNYFE